MQLRRSSSVAIGLVGTYTLTNAGEDIWSTSDEFRYAWKTLSGPGSIVAKVESVSDTDVWTKAGVMMRATLEPDSQYAAVYIASGNGCRFQARAGAGILAVSDSSVASDDQKAVQAPYWIKLERTASGSFFAYRSADGAQWRVLGWNPPPITMPAEFHVGLALTSHNAEAVATGVFSNVSVTGDVSGQWASQDIGRNVAETLSLTLTDGSAAQWSEPHPDPNAVLAADWTPWMLELSKFSDAGVDLSDVRSISIGIGLEGNPEAGGVGRIHFDDIRLDRPRCLPAVVKPQADLNDDCLVDYLDLDIMASTWLEGDRTDDGLLGYWPFDGDAQDMSGHGHHGDPCETPLYAAGQLNQAVVFDEPNDMIVHDLALPRQTGAIAHWLKLDTLKRMAAYYEGSTLQNGWTAGDADVLEIHTGINGDDGRLYFCYQDGPGGASQTTITAGETAQAGVWIHVAVTWDRAGDAIMYADGVDVERRDMTTKSFGANVGIYHLVGGPSDRGTDRDWDGAIDDVRVYDRPLTPEEIASVMAGDTLGDYYYAVASPANVSDDEPVDSKRVDAKDFVLLANEWLDLIFWP